ncbi:MAG: hypothetical protein A3F10_04275 [Coxiella sp. RIFCSPHIGHO2_12_FULL_42_15]|nr:MAG: hypothetical protein A3F10_04275 [Coxiella sp. RIFCSPHIGHO2_12_FULL_42_15]
MLLVSSFCLAEQLPLPEKNQTLMGKLVSHQVQTDETLAGIARQYDVGYFELLAANPHVNPRTLTSGTLLIIPKQFILPNLPHKGIIINIGTMRLFYFPKGKDYFFTYPVGIGKQDWGTPLGVLSIIQKIADPVWYVPQSIYDFRKAEGDPVPHKVPPGPDNPLGDYALRLSKPTYLIHGTNEPESVGVRSSAGCIHLYPEDIKTLFANISIGEPVIIINQPYQANWSNNTLYVEAHLPLAEDRNKLADPTMNSLDIVNAIAKIPMRIDWGLAQEAIKDHTGIPIAVGQTDESTEISTQDEQKWG